MKIHESGSNYTVLYFDAKDIYALFSYKTLIAVNTGKGFFATSTKYSRITSKHLSRYLNGAFHKLIPQKQLELMIS